MLHQRSRGVRTDCAIKQVQRGEDTFQRDLVETRYASSRIRIGHAVEVAIGSLHHSDLWVLPIRRREEAVEHLERPGRGHVEDHASAVRTALVGRSIELAVRPLDHGRDRPVTVSAGEGVKHRQLSGGADFEDRSGVVGSSELRRPIQVPVGSLHQGRGGVRCRPCLP